MCKHDLIIWNLKLQSQLRSNFGVREHQIIMNTYVNVAFLRLLLSAEQLAKSDQHLEEELIFCAQPNPLSQ